MTACTQQERNVMRCRDSRSAKGRNTR